MVDEMGNDDFQIKTSKTNLGLQVNFHLNKQYYWAFDNIKQAIIDGSPVYDNVIRTIPIEVNQSKENESND